MPKRYLYLLTGAVLAYLLMKKRAMTPQNLPEPVEDSGWWPSWLTW